MKIKITADSTADLSKELCEKYNIDLIPLCVSLGDQIFDDGVTIQPDMIYDFVAKTKQMPKTSAVNSERYKEKFAKIFSEGYDAIIHLSISSEMSVSHNNAKALTAEMPNLFVIDSQTLSSAIGLQAIYASELAQSGKYTAQQIVEMVEKRKPFAQASFILDKLEYLYRGGRCSMLKLLGANLLHIKPCIEVHNGKMGVGKKYIGKLDKCVLKYVADILNNYKSPDTTRIFITHSKIDQQIVESVKQYILNNTQFKEILITTAGCTITSHCGSNCIGILFYTDGENAIKD